MRYARLVDGKTNVKGNVNFLPEALKLPNATRKVPIPLYGYSFKPSDVSYDTVVFDTYDYFDQVISFSLKDVFIAAFSVYMEKEKDSLAGPMNELIRYGTNDSVNILLMRYGFPAEEVVEISKYIAFINEQEIRFLPEIDSAPLYIKDLVEWYR